jgi:hypothetical protein
MKHRKLIAATFVAGLVLTGCGSDASDANVASQNLSTAADQFELNRRIVFFNGITDTYLLEISGRCSIADQGHQLEVTCKTSESGYKKHFLGLSDNVSYFVEQLEGVDVSVYHYRVIFKPELILPDIDLVTSGG